MTSDPLLTAASGASDPLGDTDSALQTSVPPVTKGGEEKEIEAFQDFINSPPASPPGTRPPVIPTDSSKVQLDVSPKTSTGFDPAKSAFHRSLFVLGAGNPPAELGIPPLSPVMSVADTPPTVEGKTAGAPSAGISGMFLLVSALLFSCLAN